MSRLALIKELSDVGNDYIPLELVKLSLSAEPVEYNAELAVVTWTAITNGIDGQNRTLTCVKEQGTYTQQITSQNTSSSDRAIATSYIYHPNEHINETVTGIIVQHGMPFHITYKIHLNEGETTSGVTIYNSGIIPTQLWVNGESVTVGNVQNLIEGDNLIQIAFSTNEIPAGLLTGLAKVTSITVTDLTISIGQQAFKNCTGAIEIKLGSNLTSIGSEAFYGCSNLTTINIPSSLVTCNTGAFSECSSLIQILYDSSVDDWCKINFTAASANPLTVGHNLYINRSLIRYLVVNADIIRDYAFSGATCLRSVTIGETTTQIKEGAFLNCTSITSINIGSKVVTFWNQCFKGCAGITSLSLSDDTQEIKDSAFEGCIALSSIILPSKVSILGHNVFEGCTRLSNIRSLNLTAAATETDTFGSINVAGATVSNKTLEVLNGSTGYASGAWGNALCNYTVCNFIKKDIPYVKCTYNITEENVGEALRILGSTITEAVIDTILLEYWSGSTRVIHRVEFPTNGTYEFSVIGNNTVTIIFSNYKTNPIVPNSAFVEIDATSVEIGTGITAVGNSGFYQSKISTLITNSSLTILGGGALSNCSNLTTVNLAEGLTTIGGDCFYNDQSLTTIDIPASVTSIGSDALSGCSNLISINVTSGNTVYMNNDSDGVLYSGTDNPTTLVQFPGGKAGDENNTFIVPSTVTALGRRCFAGNAKVEKVDLSQSQITSIADYAFNNCTLLSTIVFGDAITGIGAWAFNECTVLNNVTLPSSLITISGYAFYKCTTLVSITIPSTVTSMGTYAFASCSSLRTVVWNAISCSTGVSVNTSTLTGATFSGCPLTSFTFADNVTAIPAGICYQQNAAELSLTMPSSAQSIGQFAFYGYTRGFNTIGNTGSIFPSGVVNIGAYAFYGCVLPNIVVLPSTLVNIDTYAFNGCSGVTSVTVPTSVSHIYIRGFASMPNMTSIIFENTVPPTIEIETFYGRNAALVIYVPSDSVADYKSAPIWTQYESLIQANNNS